MLVIQNPVFADVLYNNQPHQDPRHNNKLYGGSTSEFSTPSPGEKLKIKSNWTILHDKDIGYEDQPC